MFLEGEFISSEIKSGLNEIKTKNVLKGILFKKNVCLLTFSKCNEC